VENGQKTISDLFESRRIFNIPQYQRSYSWQEKQLQDFINDLKIQNVEKDYFFGTLLLQIRQSEGLFKIIDLVDGQQRLTTLIIFMHLLLQKLEEAGDDVSILREGYVKYRDQYKLRVLEYDNDFFQRYIMGDAPKGEDAVTTPSQRRMLEARKFFENELTDVSLETAREYREKIECAKVLTYAVSNNAGATLIFETTNDRGKPLTSLEKIKSYLMYKVYLTAKQPEKHLEAIQARFSAIYKDYEDLRSRWYLDEDFILRNHYIAFVAKDSSESLSGFSKHLNMVKDKIHMLASDPDRESEAAEFIDRYSRELAETFAVCNALSKLLGGNLLNIIYLDRVANFFPLLIVALRSDKSENRQNFQRVAKLLEIMSFRVYGIRKRKTNNIAIVKRLFSLAQQFSGDYEILIENLKDLVGEYCSDYEFEKRLDSPTLYEDIASNELTYLLWQYENHLRASQDGSYIAYRRYRSLSVDHIIPQNPRFVPYWMTSDFYEEHLHCLGNLVIDTGPENSSKSNLSFEIKYRYYYHESRFRSQEELIDFADPETNEWREDSIPARHCKLMRFVRRNWDYKAV
jgi:hypothetical protein